MNSRAHEATTDSGLMSLITVAHLHQVAADAEQLRHQFGTSGETLHESTLLRAAQWLGLKARWFQSDLKRLRATALPAIARMNNGEYLIVAGLRDDLLLLKRADSQTPQTENLDVFNAQWSGRLLLLTRRAAIRSGLQSFDFSWFIPFISKYRKYLGEVLLASFFLQLFALVTPLFFQVVIDKVLVHRGLTTLDILGVALLTVSIFEVVLGGLRSYVFAHTTNRIDVALGAELFKHLLRLPVAYFEARRVGDTVARVRELDSIRNFITGSSLTVLVDSVFTVVFFAVMTLYSPTLTLVVAATLPLYGLLAFFVTPALRARLNEMFDRGADNQAYLVETVSAIQTLKAAAVEPASQRRWEERLSAYVAASFRTTNLSNIANQGAAFINKLMVLGILWMGAHLVMRGALTVGQLVAFNMLAGRIAGPILRLVQLWQDFQQAGVSVRRLGDILNAVPEPAHSPSRGSLPELIGRVSFEHVTFRYRIDGPEVLVDVSLDAKPGTVLGIVGRSGSGKSTLTKLVHRWCCP
jgi:subfamily B ATP-binding cassette protein HlyB/CyaB